MTLFEWDQPRVAQLGVNEHLIWRYQEYCDAQRGLLDKWNVKFANGYFW